MAPAGRRWSRPGGPNSAPYPLCMHSVVGAVVGIVTCLAWGKLSCSTWSYDPSGACIPIDAFPVGILVGVGAAAMTRRIGSRTPKTDPEQEAAIDARRRRWQDE